MIKRNFIVWSSCILLFLLSSCTKVMDLSDHVKVNGFNVKSVTPTGIELGTPVIKGDTIVIPVLRGVTLFPMSISAEVECSPETDQVVTGTSFESFSDIKFDLEDIHFNTFYLVAKSGLTKAYYIKLDVDEQLDRNDFRELLVTGLSQPDAIVSTKGFVNPVNRTINLYGVQNNFPLDVYASAILSDSAHIRYENKILDNESLNLKFNKYGDSIVYMVEAENGAAEKWTIYFKKAIEASGAESSDIKSALSLKTENQSAEVKTPGYKINNIVVDNDLSKLIFVIAPLSRSMNVEIVPTVKTLSNSQVLGYVAGEGVVFENYSSTNNFIILDARTGYYKKWQFALYQGDIGDIYSFPFTHRDNTTAGDYIRIDTSLTVIDNINKRITLTVTRTSAATRYWPLTVTSGNVKYSPGATLNIAPLVFTNINDSATFKLTSSLNVESDWVVKLATIVTKGNADIDSIKMLNSSYPLHNEDVIINSYTADVFIDLKDRKAFPLRIQPFMYLSEGAEFVEFQNGDFMEFNSFEDTVKIEVISRLGEVKTWKFQLLEKSQLYNSDFELWITSGTPTIDPIPGKGRGWATANNIMVKGTNPVNNGTNGKAAEMVTGITSLPKNLITSGTLFLGYFDMSTITLDKPREMTKFGIPFEARPVAIAVDAKYKPGPNYQESVWVSGSGISAKYDLVNLSGEDRGQIWVELIHWSGEGRLNYSGEPTDGVTVLARGEYIISGETGWSRLNIPLIKNAGYDQYSPTHLVVVMASSIDGHLFKGAKDSKLTVDNFELIY